MINNIADDKQEMLKWLSEKNRHIPLSDLAFMLDMPENDDVEPAETINIFDWN